MNSTLKMKGGLIKYSIGRTSTFCIKISIASSRIIDILYMNENKKYHWQKCSTDLISNYYTICYQIICTLVNEIRKSTNFVTHAKKYKIQNAWIAHVVWKRVSEIISMNIWWKHIVINFGRSRNLVEIDDIIHCIFFI